MSEFSVNEQPFGYAPDGTPVHRWVLRAPNGFSAAILTYGAILQSCLVPGRDGSLTESVLRLSTAEAYAQDSVYLGAVVGRYANRIADGQFVLDGVTHRLATNQGPHTLHGGPDGFHRRVWSASGLRKADAAAVALRLHSPHGDMGFPGNLGSEVVYRIDDSCRLTVSYRATADRPTVVNLTQHAYWNLAGSGTIADHELTVEADAYLPTDSEGIPVDGMAATAGTSFALGRPLGEIVRDPHPDIVVAGGLDHCFALRGGRTPSPRLAARLTHPGSGRTLEVRTTEPGLQVYTANTLGPPFTVHGAVCLETQHFPDTPNRPQYPSTALRPGQVYRSTTEYRFAAVPPCESQPA